MHKKHILLAVLVLVALLAVQLLSVRVPSVNAQDGSITLRLAWWGGDARHEKYNQLADMYEELHPNITIEREFADWGGYWDRLATQSAGGNTPDIIHMHAAYLATYADRGVLLPLDELASQGMLDLSQFPQGIIDSGSMNDTIYMISLGNSSSGTHYNADCFEAAGLDVPDYAWTWADWEATAIALTGVMGEGTLGTFDSGDWDATLEFYMLQHANGLFSEDGELGFGRDELEAYWSMWERLREAGALPPAEVTSERGTDIHADSMLARGEVCMQFMSGNQHKLFQNATEYQLGLSTLPRSTDPNAPSGDVVAGAYISLSSDLEDNPEKLAAAADFINWMVNDPDVAMIYNAEHGVPGSLAMQEVIMPNMDPADVRLMEMMQFISPTAVMPPIRPSYASQVIEVYAAAYQGLAAGELDLDEALDQFFDEVDFIIE